LESALLNASNTNGGSGFDNFPLKQKYPGFRGIFVCIGN
jgi:hypothetical protein